MLRPFTRHRPLRSQWMRSSLFYHKSIASLQPFRAHSSDTVTFTSSRSEQSTRGNTSRPPQGDTPVAQLAESFCEIRRTNEDNFEDEGREDDLDERDDALDESLVEEEIWAEATEDLQLDSKNDLGQLPRGTHSTRLREQLTAALEARDSDAILAAAIAASQDQEFFSSLPRTTIAEILHWIDPRDFLDGYKTAFKYRIGAPVFWIENNSKTTSFRHMREALEDFVDSIRSLLIKWRGLGHSFDLPMYKVMLRMASATGDGDGAKFLFTQLQEEPGLEADTEAYNLFFDARCWHNYYDPVERYHLRVTPRSLRIRGSIGQEHTYGYSGYRAGDCGLKKEVSDHFAAMTRSGLIANADTFYSLIVAMGREGDLTAVSSMLKRVWDIDVQAVINAQSDEVYFENEISPESPLYPTPRLLFILAHVYGSNSRISAALRLVDHVSRKYSLEIKEDTWHELAEWTYVLSCQRSGKNSLREQRRIRAREDEEGRIPYDSFEGLWQTMTSVPYNIKPTPALHRMRITALMRRGLAAEMISAIREARHSMRLGRSGRMTYKRLIKEMITTSLKGYPSSSKDRLNEVDLLKRHFEYLTLQRCVRLLFVIGQPWTVRNPEDITSVIALGVSYEREWVPNLVHEFGRLTTFIHRGISYNTSTGRVHFPRTFHRGESKVAICDAPSKLQLPGLPANNRQRRGLQIVSHLQKSLKIPFSEQTRAQYLIQQRYELVTQGKMYAKDAPLAWHEKNEVGDWIWLDNDRGYRSVALMGSAHGLG